MPASESTENAFSFSYLSILFAVAKNAEIWGLYCENSELRITAERPQSELLVTKNVNHILKNEVYGLQQYHQQLHVIIDGLESVPNQAILQVTQVRS